jgi:beta-lactamase class C
MKKSILKIAITFGISLLLGIQPCYSYPATNIDEAIAKLDMYIKLQVQRKHIPGCAVAVVYQNKVIFMHGYGVKSIGKPEKIDADTVFQLGSVSKPVAASLVSILENKGFIKFEDPVHHYLPQFALNSRQPQRTVKIKHILSHSTGVPRAGFNNLIESHASYPHILKALQNTPVRSAVGKQYDYHNAMYGLLSNITESATGVSFQHSLEANLLKPLKMTNTSATLSGLLQTTNRATPHVRNQRGALMPCDHYSKGYYNVAPAGGINSSIRDMAIFLKAQLGGYPEVLNHRALARIQLPQIPTQNSLSASDAPPQTIKNARYAYGWRVVDFAHSKLVFHGGWVKGFTNFIAFMPEHEVGIVVLHNSEAKFSSRAAVKFFESLLKLPLNKQPLKMNKSSLMIQHNRRFDALKTTSTKSSQKLSKKRAPVKRLKLKKVATHIRIKHASATP